MDILSGPESAQWADLLWMSVQMRYTAGQLHIYGEPAQTMLTKKY